MKDTSINITIQSVIKICQIHVKRLEFAIKKIQNFFPLSSEKFNQLTEEEVAYFDLFSIRFCKLQDYMGNKLFPLVLDFSKEQGELSAFIDKLNRLEKIKAIPSAEKWSDLREIRNELSHDYSEDSLLLSHKLNAAFEKVQELLNTLKIIVHFVEKREHV
ncbi:MAG: hypothetical protein ACKOAD_00815 [Gammaproteobacteria bacterium]